MQIVFTMFSYFKLWVTIFFPVPLSYLPLSQVKSSLFMVIKIINIHHFLIAVLFPSLATWRTVARLMGLSDSVRQHRNIQCPQAEVWEIELFSGASLGQVTGRRRMEGFQDSTRQSCNWSDIALVLWDDGLETCRGPSHTNVSVSFSLLWSSLELETSFIISTLWHLRARSKVQIYAKAWTHPSAPASAPWWFLQGKFMPGIL